MNEQAIEQALIEKLGELKYNYRPDIRDRTTLEQNFREKFEALNRVNLTDGEFARLLDQIVTADVFAAARHLRDRNSFERDDGTPLIYTLVNIKKWCKNTFEVVNQLRTRTNRVLNDTKPYGSILDFRQQQESVDQAITLFSGKHSEQAREIWLVDGAPAVIDKLEAAVTKLDDFMQSQELKCTPEEVLNLKGDAARSQFVTLFKEVQRFKTQLDQYTDLTPENAEEIDQVIAPERLQAFRGVYLETAQRLKAQQEKRDTNTSPEVEQLDFEFVLFASAVIDYDYIMELIARYTQEAPSKQPMSRARLIGLIQSDAKFMDDRDDIAAYIDTLEVGKGLDERAIREGYEAFKAERSTRELTEIATRHGLEPAALQGFVDGILRRMIFDGELLSDLMAPLGLGWKARTRKELALVEDLMPLLQKLAQGQEIAGLKAYE